MDIRAASKRLVRALLLAPLCWAGAATAQAGGDCPPAAERLTQERIAAGMRAAEDRGFLWRISKDGRTSYLYGTIHAAKPEWMFPGPTVREAIEASDSVALELDVLDDAVQRRLAESMKASRETPLPAELARRLRVQMAVECADAAALGKLAPELQIASLALLAARRDGLDPSYGIDLLIAGYARGAGKPVVSLETPEAQIDALRMPTPAATLEFVERGLADLETRHARPLLNRLAEMWSSGDWRALAAYDDWCDCRRTPLERELMKRVVEDRNPALADAVDALHAGGKRVFAAVGTLHLYGPRGLPELLRRRGYKIEQGDFSR